jgi:uncharacterized protein (TIGR03083 family)
MQRTHPTTDSRETPDYTREAATIPPAGPEEAVVRATTELERLLSLLESLNAQDWNTPTYCTHWNVRQVASHLAGATAMFADREPLVERSAPWLGGRAEEPGQTMAGFLADLAGVPTARRQVYRDAGFNPLDTLTQFQVDERAEAPPEELVAELRATGQTAIANRRHMPEAVRSLQLPISTGVRVPVHVFVDVILPRDMWMHRMEIALATDRDIVRTAEHEGRLTALVMRDLARRLVPSLGDASIIYHLTGPDGGTFLYGSDSMPATTLTMDAVDFHLLASGRLSPQEACAQARVTIEGKAELAGRVLNQTTVPY